MKKLFGLTLSLLLVFSFYSKVDAANWSGYDSANINYQTEQSSGSYYWGYGLRDSFSYSYGYSNYFNPSSQHYSGVNYAGINDRQSAGAGKSTYTESRDKTSGANGRYAFCYIGVGM